MKVELCGEWTVNLWLTRMLVNSIDAIISPKFGREDDAHAGGDRSVDKGLMYDVDVGTVEDVYKDIDSLESFLKIGR